MITEVVREVYGEGHASEESVEAFRDMIYYCIELLLKLSVEDATKKGARRITPLNIKDGLESNQSLCDSLFRIPNEGVPKVVDESKLQKSYEKQIYNILVRINMGFGISEKAMRIMNLFVNDFVIANINTTLTLQNPENPRELTYNIVLEAFQKNYSPDLYKNAFLYYKNSEI